MGALLFKQSKNITNLYYKQLKAFENTNLSKIFFILSKFSIFDNSDGDIVDNSDNSGSDSDINDRSTTNISRQRAVNRYHTVPWWLRIMFV